MKKANHEEKFTPWLPNSDLMIGLLMALCLVVVFYMQQLDKTKDTKAKVFSVLEKELKEAGIDPKVNPQTGTIEIADNILFESNRAELSEQGKKYIDGLTPALARAFQAVKGADDEIVSIDIEGHASQNIKDKIFIKQMMNLSLARSQNVWRQIYETDIPENYPDFIRKVRVAGWGNTLATSEEDNKDERKVVFKLQFVNKATEVASKVISKTTEGMK